jgi:hypothetical protein
VLSLILDLYHLVLSLQSFLISDEEKTLVSEVFNNAMDALSEEDKKLPQVRLIPRIRIPFVNVTVHC